MCHSKRLQCVIRTGVVALVLGTCSFAWSQTHYTTTNAPQQPTQHQSQQQHQAAPQKSGGLFSKIGDWIKGDDDDKKNANTSVAPANAPPPQQSQQQIQTQQQFQAQQVTPPRPNSAGGYSATNTATRPTTSPQSNSLSQQMAAQSSVTSGYATSNGGYASTGGGYGTSQSVATGRPTLAQSVGGTPNAPQTTSSAANGAGTLSRMQEMQDRILNMSVGSSTRVASTRPSTSLSGSGPPTPPPTVSGTEQATGSGSARERSALSTDDDETPGSRNLTQGSTQDSLSTDDDEFVETPPTRIGRRTAIDMPPIEPRDEPVRNTTSNATTNDAERPPSSMGHPIPRVQAESPLTEIPRTDAVRSVPVRNIDEMLAAVPDRASPGPMRPVQNDGLIRQQSPVLSTVARGPDSIIVGKEEKYQFTVTNNSSVLAENVVLDIELPRWTENTQPPELTTGSTTILPRDDDYATLQWKIGEVAGNKSETLILHIVPRERRSFNLKSDISFSQSASQAKIEVQQPAIKMELEGPQSVLWGVEESYSLRVRNVGNGDAKNLLLKLSASDAVKGETTIDLLKVGEERILDVIVAAQQYDLQIQVQAVGPYGLHEEMSKDVTVRRADLELDIDAPGMQHVDNAIEYVLIVRNTGTAASVNSILEAVLPLGVRYESSSHDGVYDSDQNVVRWDAGTISVGAEFVCTLACTAKREGECRLDARATELTGLLQSANVATYVEAIADLTLDVEKPKGPIEVGTTAEYLVTVANLGSKAAENIDIGVYFPADAVEPIEVEGANAQIKRREVVFERITQLPAGEVRKYRVKVRGLMPGNHKVQTVMVCPSIETSLTNEQVSRFYMSRNSAANIGTINEPDISQDRPISAMPFMPPSAPQSSALQPGVPPLTAETPQPPPMAPALSSSPTQSPALSPMSTNPMSLPNLSTPGPDNTTSPSVPLMGMPSSAPNSAPLPPSESVRALRQPATQSPLYQSSATGALSPSALGMAAAPDANNRVAMANTNAPAPASATGNTASNRGGLLSNAMQAENVASGTAPGVSLNQAPNVTVAPPARVNRTGNTVTPLLAPPPVPANIGASDSAE